MNQLRKNLLPPLIVSMLLHLLFLDFYWQFADTWWKKDNKTLGHHPRAIEIKKLSKEEIAQIKRLKTVGVKNGNDKFSMKLPPPSTNNLPPIPLKNLALKQLKEFKSATKSTSSPPLTPAQTEEKFIEVSNSKQEQNYKQKNDLSFANQSSAQLLRYSDMNVKFAAPTGVSESELNSLEKIYYGFQKRTYESYITSFFSTFNNSLISRPALRTTIFNKPHKLTGRIIFDKDGNIVTIKIIKGSNDDDVQQVFEDTLKGIGSLPNPPQQLVKDGTIAVYYDLYINL